MVTRSNFEGKKGYILCISAVILSLISMALYDYTVKEQAKIIKTQAEYIEWKERIERETEIESEHMNMLEEMRKGNE